MEFEGSRGNESTNEVASDTVRELSRRRETGEIGEENYPIENLIFLASEGTPIFRE